MKSYPKIPHEPVETYCYVFNKLDGSNMRAEWSQKKGFYKFGTRTKLLGEGDGDPIFFGVPDLVRQKYGKSLSDICKQRGWEKCTFFFEYFGEHSFAGFHLEKDRKDVILIDASPHKKGILPPADFVEIFKDVDSAELLFQGNVDEDYFNMVRSRQIQGMSVEGVVCKYIDRKGRVKRFKVKTDDWYEGLKEKVNYSEEMFNKLR